MLDGWVKLHRSFLDSWIWKRRDKGLVVFWIYLLAKAAHEPTEASFSDCKVPLDTAQVLVGRKVAADACGLTESKVRSFLKLLETNDSITIEATNRYSIITICNWQKYQGQANDIPADKPMPMPKPKRPSKPKAPPKNPAPFRQFTDAFCQGWQQAHGDKYPWQKKDGPVASMIWDHCNNDIAKGCRVIGRYFKSTDGFYESHQLSLLLHGIAKFLPEPASTNQLPFSTAGIDSEGSP